MGMKQQHYLSSLQLLCLGEQFRRCSQIYCVCVCVGEGEGGRGGETISEPQPRTYGRDHNTRP